MPHLSYFLYKIKFFEMMFFILILQVVDNSAPKQLLLTELMKSNLFNHKGMLALVFCLLLIYTKLLSVTETESI